MNELAIVVYIYANNEECAIKVHDKEENSTTSQQWMLPATEFHGLWDTLVYDHTIQTTLLNYIYAAMLLSGLSA
jgi:hypothetical protein